MSRPVSDLSAVRRPIHLAQDLPNAHYTDASAFDEENHALLMAQWAGLAVAADVPEPGDAVPMTFLGMPLLLIRDRQGQVRVLQNTCRHRGMILVDAPRKIEGAIRCPYHSWCYSTECRLVSTPHVGGPGRNTHDGIDRDSLSLIEVRSHVWIDVVWINMSGAENRFQLTVNCNWKLAVENHCESYHLPWVHPGLNSYSRLEDRYHIEKPGEYSGQGTQVHRQIRNENGEVFPDFAALSGKWNTAAEFIAAYPNVLLGVHRDHAFAIILVPDGVDRTVENVHIYYAQPATDEGLRARNAQQWKTVFEEDIFVVEGMQRGRLAPGFDGGRFSPVMDGPTHLFHDWVAGKLLSHRSPGRAAE